jgi:hypothetical protein
MDLGTMLSVAIGAFGLILTLSTFLLNLILKELKELRQAIQALVLENATNRERIAILEQCYRNLRCRECNHG